MKIHMVADNTVNKNAEIVFRMNKPSAYLRDIVIAYPENRVPSTINPRSKRTAIHTVVRDLLEYLTEEENTPDHVVWIITKCPYVVTSVWHDAVFSVTDCGVLVSFDERFVGSSIPTVMRTLWGIEDEFGYVASKALKRIRKLRNQVLEGHNSTSAFVDAVRKACSLGGEAEHAALAEMRQLRGSRYVE